MLEPAPKARGTVPGHGEVQAGTGGGCPVPGTFASGTAPGCTVLFRLGSNIVHKAVRCCPQTKK